MPTLVAHKIQLNPNNRQATFFARCAGVSRKAYNWALAEWQRQYSEGEKPNEVALRKHLNSIKKEEFPWMMEVPKSVPQQAIKNLGVAFTNFFRRVRAKAKHKGYPKFKKKKVSKDAFRIDNGDVSVDFQKQMLWVPKLGWVRMAELPRFEGRITQAIVSRDADRWFVSLTIHSDFDSATSESQAIVGIDLGVNKLAVLSTGEEFLSPKPLKNSLKKLARANRRLHKKVKGSNRRDKARKAVARIHKRIRNIRQDFLHKLTTYLAQKFAIVAIEDLNVSGMMANSKLAKAISDLGFFEFRRQLEYKLRKFGGRLVVVDRWFPSSKACSRCGCVKESLSLADRTYTCEDCGFTLDRDLNASFNLLRKAFLEFNISDVPQVLREVTLVDTLALLDQAFGQATEVEETRRNQQDCSLVGNFV